MKFNLSSSTSKITTTTTTANINEKKINALEHTNGYIDFHFLVVQKAFPLEIMEFLIPIADNSYYKVRI